MSPTSPCSPKMMMMCLTACLATFATVRAEDSRVVKKHALLIGINDFSNAKLPELKFSAADATAIQEVLSSQGWQCNLLVNQQATREDILKQLEATTKSAAAGDMLLVYYSGQGLQLAGPEPGPFLLATDSTREPASFLNVASIVDAMEKSFADHKLLFMDACRNDPDAGRGLDSSGNIQVPRNFVLFSACSVGEACYELDDLKHGVFTYSLLRGLSGGACNSRNEITPTGLFEFVREEMIRMMIEHLPERHQNPSCRMFSEGRAPILVKCVSTIDQTPSPAAQPSLR